MALSHQDNLIARRREQKLARALAQASRDLQVRTAAGSGGNGLAGRLAAALLLVLGALALAGILREYWG